MKKLSLLIISLILGFSAATFANDCKQIEFGSSRTCVNIEKQSDSVFRLQTNIEKGEGSLQCWILVGESNSLKTVDCNGGEFMVNNNKTQKIVLYMKFGGIYPTDREGKPSSSSSWKFPQWLYDFDDGEWSNSNSNNDDDDDNGGSSDGDLDNFLISLSDSTPDTNDQVKLTIKARDDDNSTLSDYDGSNAEITVKYRSSSSSSRYTASSSYYSINDNTPSFSNGVTSTYITFYRDYDYKIIVTDDDENITDEQIFYIGDNGGSSDGDLDNFLISLSDSTPDTNDQVKLTIKARDDDNSTLSDYDGSNAEITVKYRSSSSSSRYTASSSYYSINDNTPSFSNGVASTYITFYRDYDYKIIVTDDDENITDEQIFYIGGSSNSNIDGFTDSEINQIQTLYNKRDSIILAYKNAYPKLKTNTTWINMAANLKTEMNQILNNSSSRLYKDYDKYKDALDNFYKYTIRYSY